MNNNNLALSVHNKNRIGKNKHYYEFDHSSSRWKLSKDNILLFNKKLDFNNSFLKEYKDVIFWYAENYSPSYTITINSIFTEFFLNFPQQISINTINLFFQHLKNNKKEASFTHFRSLLKKWNEFYPFTVPLNLIKAVDKISVPSPIKGRPVKSRCPIKGPFTDLERQNIVEGISFAFEKSKISQQDFALVWFFLATGRRLKQASILKIADLINNNDQLFINVPRIKQRNGEFRETFRAVELTREIYLTFERQKQYVVQTIEKTFNCKLDNKKIGNLPFFIDQSIFNNASLEYYTKNMYKDVFHMTSASLGVELHSISKLAEIYSERTNDLINLTAHRFRYTYGCMLARDGASEEEIAYMLDHGDTQSVGIYIENPSDFVYELTEKLDQFLTPISKAFKGEIVDPKFRAVKNINNKSLIRTNDSELGLCGTHSHCSFDIPMPCYTCQNFKPWKDIDLHKPILSKLRKRRKMLIKNDVDMNVVINLDNTILAVSEILKKCKDG